MTSYNPDDPSNPGKTTVSAVSIFIRDFEKALTERRSLPTLPAVESHLYEFVPRLNRAITDDLSPGPNAHHATIDEIAHAYTILYAFVPPKLAALLVDLDLDYETVRLVSETYAPETVFDAFAAQPVTIALAHFSSFCGHPRWALRRLLDIIFDQLEASHPNHGSSADPGEYTRILELLQNVSRSSQILHLSSPSGVFPTVGRHLADVVPERKGLFLEALSISPKAVASIPLPTARNCFLTALDDVRPREVTFRDPSDFADYAVARPPSERYRLLSHLSTEHLIEVAVSGRFTPDLARHLTAPQMQAVPGTSLSWFLHKLSLRHPDSVGTHTAFEALITAHNDRFFDRAPHPGFECPRTAQYLSARANDNSSLSYVDFESAARRLSVSARLKLVPAHAIWRQDLTELSRLAAAHDVNLSPAQLQAVLELQCSFAQLVRHAPLFATLSSAELDDLSAIIAIFELPLDLIIETLSASDISLRNLYELLHSGLSLPEIHSLCN